MPFQGVFACLGSRPLSGPCPEVRLNDHDIFGISLRPPKRTIQSELVRCAIGSSTWTAREVHPKEHSYVAELVGRRFRHRWPWIEVPTAIETDADSSLRRVGIAFDPVGVGVER